MHQSEAPADLPVMHASPAVLGVVLNAQELGWAHATPDRVVRRGVLNVRKLRSDETKQAGLEPDGANRA